MIMLVSVLILQKQLQYKEELLQQPLLLAYFSKIHIAAYEISHRLLQHIGSIKIPHLKYQSKMIGVFLCIPGRFSTSHFYNNTANAPHITAPTILLSSQNLNRQTDQSSDYPLQSVITLSNLDEKKTSAKGILIDTSG